MALGEPEPKVTRSWGASPSPSRWWRQRRRRRRAQTSMRPVFAAATAAPRCAVQVLVIAEPAGLSSSAAEAMSERLASRRWLLAGTVLAVEPTSCACGLHSWRFARRSLVGGLRAARAAPFAWSRPSALRMVASGRRLAVPAAVRRLQLARARAYGGSRRQRRHLARRAYADRRVGGAVDGRAAHAERAL